MGRCAGGGGAYPSCQRRRRFVGWLLVQHLAWSIWIVLAFQGETRYLLFTLLQGVLLLALAIISRLGAAPIERNHHEQNRETVTG